MKRNQLYRQCRLVKRLRDGVAVQVSYLPAEYARVGRIVQVRENDGDWDDGWVIRAIGPSASADELDAIEAALAADRTPVLA